MSKHMVSRLAICPYYRHEDPQVIYCDGVREGSVIHLAFADRSCAKCYKQTYCRKRFQECEIYQMLDKIDREAR